MRTCCVSAITSKRRIQPEPDSGEFTCFLAGIGFVLGVGLEDGEPTGDRDELVCSGDSLAILDDPSCGIGDAGRIAPLKTALCRLSPDAFCEDQDRQDHHRGRQLPRHFFALGVGDARAMQA